MRSLLIHPEELTEKWIKRMAENGVEVLALHPAGGKNAHESLKSMLETIKTPAYQNLLAFAESLGLKIEYEFHAGSYLLPRELYDEHPEYFRMDENGNRVREIDFCVSNQQALDIVATRAVNLAKELNQKGDDYYFWLDDAKNAGCQCEKCKNLSPSDKNLIVMNAIVKELRKFKPNARVAYLAYQQTMPLPTAVKPEEGIFLEYAPISRKLDVPLSGHAGEWISGVKDLLGFFGKENSKVLEYWFDNSLFSGWKKPPVKFTPNAEVIKADLEYYSDLGFENISSFACYLGEDYEQLFGEPDVTAFKR